MGKCPWKSLFLQHVAIVYDSTFVITCTAFVNFFDVTPQVTPPYLKMTPQSKSIFWKWTPAKWNPPTPPLTGNKGPVPESKREWSCWEVNLNSQSVFSLAMWKHHIRFSGRAKSVVSYFSPLRLSPSLACGAFHTWSFISLTPQGHPTTTFGKYLCGRRFEI